MPSWINLANLFTLIRLSAIPFLVSAILQGRSLPALWIFMGAAATDSIDGTLARHFGMATRVGAYLDPIADKLFLISLYLSLAAIGDVPWWLVVVIFARDFVLLLSCAIALFFTRLRRFPPSLWGKASTFLQIVYVFTVLARNAITGPSNVETALVQSAAALIWPVAALAVFSGVHYIWRGFRLLAAPSGLPTFGN